MTVDKVNQIALDVIANQAMSFNKVGNVVFQKLAVVVALEFKSKQNVML
jgi:hypothetical protein